MKYSLQPECTLKFVDNQEEDKTSLGEHSFKIDNKKNIDIQNIIENGVPITTKSLRREQPTAVLPSEQAASIILPSDHAVQLNTLTDEMTQVTEIEATNATEKKGDTFISFQNS